jgi:plastocyanin
MKKIILLVVAVLVVAIIAIFGFSAMSWPKSTGNQVDLQFFSFHPGTLTVSVGTTVTWTDKDWLIPHNVIGSGWSSDNLSHGGTFSYTFTQAGTYTYRCSHHFWMKGKIIVQ